MVKYGGNGYSNDDDINNYSEVKKRKNARVDNYSPPPKRRNIVHQKTTLTNIGITHISKVQEQQDEIKFTSEDGIEYIKLAEDLSIDMTSTNNKIIFSKFKEGQDVVNTQSDIGYVSSIYQEMIMYLRMRSTLNDVGE